MHTPFRRSTILAATLLLIGAGCSAPAGPGGPSSATAAASGCTHPYYPLIEGHQIVYATRTAGHEATMTMKVTAASANGATLTMTIGDITSTQEITCDHGALSSRGSVNFAATGVAASGKSETRSSSGTFLPERLAVGATWDSSSETAVTMTLPAAAARLNGGNTVMEIVSDVTTHSEAISEEDVTVPAGTYRAVKVKSTVTTTSHGGLPGMDQPRTTETTAWFVRDVGMIKSTNADGSSITEATSVTR